MPTTRSSDCPRETKALNPSPHPDMSKEQATPKRTTRSSSSFPAKPPPKPANPAGPITLDDLLPGRRDQVLEILRLIGPPNSPMLPLFLYGCPSTGKTRTVIRILRHLARPFAYASCRSFHTPRLLFETILDQLTNHRKGLDNGFASSRRCERPSEFVDLLRNAVRDRVGRVKETVYLVFDNVELVSRWGRNPGLIAVLLRLYDMLRLPELGLIYISCDDPDAFYSHAGSTEPIGVFFPNYTEDEVYQILMRKQANAELYSSFLKVVLKPFLRVTRRLDEISIALKPLFEKYSEPLNDLSVVPDEAMKRRLYDNIHPHLVQALDQTFKVTSSSAVVEKGKPVTRKRNLGNSGWGGASDGLDFHMSVSAKYLLISAFLASRNPATLDAAMFDSTGGSGNQKRKRKSSELSIQKKQNKEQEILMKGPGTFSLERLLVIFQCITSVADLTLEEEASEHGKSHQDGEIDLMSDVLLQLSTLCNAKFIFKGGSCPLEGSNRYRSTVDEEMALQVARSINFPLPKYMYRR